MSAAPAAAANVGADRTGIDTLGPRFARSSCPNSAGNRRRSPRSSEFSVPSRTSLVTHSPVAPRPPWACSERPLQCTSARTTHEITRSAAPSTQAEDEHRQLTRSLSVLRAFEQPLANDVVDAVREATMVANLAALRSEGSVVAVVGFDHLSGITELLDNRGLTRYDPSGKSMDRFWN